MGICNANIPRTIVMCLICLMRVLYLKKKKWGNLCQKFWTDDGFSFLCFELKGLNLQTFSNRVTTHSLKIGMVFWENILVIQKIFFKNFSKLFDYNSPFQISLFLLLNKNVYVAVKRKTYNLDVIETFYGTFFFLWIFFFN